MRQRVPSAGDRGSAAATTHGEPPAAAASALSVCTTVLYTAVASLTLTRDLKRYKDRYLVSASAAVKALGCEEIERRIVAELRAAPPGPGWNGAYVMREK
jgi:sulfite reductase beta subunit-like hemoprotein